MKIGLLFVVLCSIAYAKKEATAPVIQQARNLMIHRDRQGALEALAQAEKSEKSTKRLAEIKKEKERLANLFFTNEGQRAFELAETIRFSGQNEYLTKYEEASKHEGAHYGLLMGLAMGMLQKKNCPKALENVQAALKMLPEKVDPQILRQRIEFCIDEKGPISGITGQTTKQQRVLVDAFGAQQAFLAQNILKAEELAKTSIDADPEYPGAYYWLWKVKLLTDTVAGVELAEKYVSLCRAMTQETRRKYFLDPELCTDTDTVEEYLKKQEGKL